MASFASISSNTLLQRQLSSRLPCKCSSSFEFHLFTHSLTLSRPRNFVLRPHFISSYAKLPATTDQEPVKSKNFGARRRPSSKSRSLGHGDDRLERESLKNLVSSLVKEKIGNGPAHNGSLRSIGKKNGSLGQNREKDIENLDLQSKWNSESLDTSSKKSKKSSKLELPDVKLRVTLDQCSKRGDFKGAIELYDSAWGSGIRLVQYHYTVLLYLCSSAATGVVRPAKSGSGSRVLNSLGSNREESSDNETVSELRDVNDGEDRAIHLSDELKEYALKRGFEIYEKMVAENVPMNEATLTSIARMAMSMGDGDMAFDTVKQMKFLGINPRLRSYGPALSVFCDKGDVQKAFEVEADMLENGVYPEEPELEALLRVSIKAGKSDKVYYLLHKLRTSVRKVSPSTAELIEKWFKSSTASRIGKRKWDQNVIRDAMRNGGGGWHGSGWLGRGSWKVLRASIGDDGSCKCCGEKLALIDLDPEETENFAESVAAIAIKRERNSSFQKFQKWLDYYGPFEAVIDGANVGLFSQQRFVPSKVNAVINGIRQKLPSKKWPLVVLHNRRITGPKMDEPINRAFFDKWRNADALYATPTGSNDDWYWLYAAIKFKCLIVTNDEMRDHTFQLLGNDFFPKWKERHQVRFGFSDGGPVFHMPPPFSVVIQESENGHWHIPIVSEDGVEADRTWLCVTRAIQKSPTVSEDKSSVHPTNSPAAPKATQIGADLKLETKDRSNHEHSKTAPRKTYESLRSIFSASVSSSESSILSDLEAAENLSNFPIDFQI